MEQDYFKNVYIKQILEKYRPIWALSHVQSLAGWDNETYMPEQGAPARGEAVAQLSLMSQQLLLDPLFQELVAKAAQESGLTDAEKGIVRVLTRAIDHYRKLPKEFVEEYAKLTSEAVVIWRNAKKAKDFSLFAPTLQKIVDLSRKQAEYLGYKDNLYDALLDQYEEGLTTEQVKTYFDSLRGPLKEILTQVMARGEFTGNQQMSELPYSQEKMAQLNASILGFFEVNADKLRLDISAHPFTQMISLRDVRITSWYHEKDWARSPLAVIHEFGHALYELQSSEEFEYSPIQSPSSLVVHESQSRFWENIIGRSEAFWLKYQRKVEELSPEIATHIAEKGQQAIYYYVNKVRPSLIRVEADEITYHFHIMLRFELELEMIRGDLKVADLPARWNEKIKEYLGIEVPSDDLGVLQDIHWSMGAFGYFPTYSMGTALSIIYKRALEQELGAIENLLVIPDGIKKIKEWLRQYVHQYGSQYTMNELLQKTLHRGFGVDDLLAYLWAKYLPSHVQKQ